MVTSTSATAAAAYLVADLARADHWTTPASWCARCGFDPCHARSDARVIPEDDGTCSYDLADPITLDLWLSLAAADAVYAVFADIPRGTRREISTALGRQIGERIASMYGGR